LHCELVELGLLAVLGKALDFEGLAFYCFVEAVGSWDLVVETDFVVVEDKDAATGYDVA